MCCRVFKWGVQNWKYFYLKINIPKDDHWILRIGVTGSCQEVTKFDFQSQFSMSKIIRIFLIFFFIEEYQFRGTFFVIDIFWKLQFLKHFVYQNHAYFSIAWFRVDDDLPKKIFYGKVLFFTQLGYHLMCKLLKKSYMLSNK